MPPISLSGDSNRIIVPFLYCTLSCRPLYFFSTVLDHPLPLKGRLLLLPGCGIQFAGGCRALKHASPLLSCHLFLHLHQSFCFIGKSSMLVLEKRLKQEGKKAAQVPAAMYFKQPVIFHTPHLRARMGGEELHGKNRP